MKDKSLVGLVIFRVIQVIADGRLREKCIAVS